MYTIQTLNFLDFKIFMAQLSGCNGRSFTVSEVLVKSISQVRGKVLKFFYRHLEGRKGNISDSIC